MTVIQVIRRNGRLYPHEIALVRITPSQNLRQELTWKEFELTVNRVANLLLSLGVRKGDNVLLTMKNCIEFLASYCAVIKTGGLVAPLNYRFTSQDIRYCGEVAEPKVVILNEDFSERVVEAQGGLKTVKNFIFWGKNSPKGMLDLKSELARLSPADFEIDLRDDDPSGLYFTSGTTGDPKPVVLMHKNLESGAMMSAVLRQLTHQDAFLLLGPMYHAGTMSWWLGHVYMGAPTVILIDAKITPQNLLGTIEKERITQSALYVPWVLDLFEALDSGRIKKEDYNLSAFRAITMGGQPIPSTLSNRWKKEFPQVTFHEGYGLTEGMGPNVFIPPEAEKKTGSIGRPVFNWDCMVVNERDEEVPVGEVGEIVLRGGGVMKEYYKNPGETARALRNGWLHTGDLGRMDEQGMFYVIDRKKDVIISGGENIYPLDVEEVLMKHPKVFDAALIGIPDVRMGEIPLAIIDPKPGVTLTEEEMAKFCEEQFPRYRRPRKIAFNKIPRDGYGKIQKLALRKKYTGAAEYFKLK
ncbi:MAG: AMP-binding protein [Chloroflexota bacterium]